MDTQIEIEKGIMIMDPIKIDKNIELPPRKTKKKHTRKRVPFYPFAKMDVGDSFFVSEKLKTQKKISAIIAYYGKKFTNKKFVYRTVPNGFRVWRTV